MRTDKMKKTVLLIAGALLALGTAAHAEGVSVEVNGARLETEAQIVNDRTMVPLRAVSNALGCGVAWDAENKGITIYRPSDGSSVPNSVIMCWIDRDHAFRMDEYSLGAGTVMDAPPMIINDRTYVPLRAVAELTGAQVSWDESTRCAQITAAVQENSISELDAFTTNLVTYEQALSSAYDEYSAYADGTIETRNVEIILKDGGKIDIELYPALAPITVNNFITHAQEGYYDGMIFHRVIKDFMIQGGGFAPDGRTRAAESIPGEFIFNGYFNLIPHKRGAVSMARTNEPNSATGQFFIVHKDSPHLDGSYAAFGNVTSGMEYVDKIAEVQTDENDKPLEDQVIEKIEVIK